MTWVAVALAGGLGAVCRVVVDRLVTSRVAGAGPWGTRVVNVSGSLAAGVVAGLSACHGLPPAVGTVVAGGFLGAYTTFSTAVGEVAQEWLQGSRPRGLLDLVGTLFTGVLAAALGWWLAC